MSSGCDAIVISGGSPAFARGQYRPELLSLLIVYERAAHPNVEACALLSTKI